MGTRSARSCEEWRELISASLDGETTPGEEAAVARHLAGCAACARVRSEYAALGAAVAAPAAAAAPATPGPNVWAAIERHATAGLAPRDADGARARAGRRVRPVARIAAAIALGLGAGFLAGRATAPPGPAPAPPPAAAVASAASPTPREAEEVAAAMFLGVLGGSGDLEQLNDQMRRMVR